MTSPNLTANQKAQAEMYDGRREAPTEVDFDHYSGKNFGPWNPYWHVYDQVRRYFRSPSQRLLSFGCGSGADALRYAAIGYQVCGFDISERRIGIARSLAEKHGYADRVAFSVQPAEALEYSPESFDIVVGVNVLHHIDVEKSMKEVARVLKKGGLAIFKEPLQTPVRDRIRNSRLGRWLVPKGTKSIPKKLKYELGPGEHMLNDHDFAIIRRYFSKLTIEKWRVLALLSVFMANKPFLEKCDWRLLRVAPFLRGLGDQAVLSMERD